MTGTITMRRFGLCVIHAGNERRRIYYSPPWQEGAHRGLEHGAIRERVSLGVWPMNARVCICVYRSAVCALPSVLRTQSVRQHCPLHFNTPGLALARNAPKPLTAPTQAPPARFFGPSRSIWTLRDLSCYSDRPDSMIMSPPPPGSDRTNCIINFDISALARVRSRGARPGT